MSAAAVQTSGTRWTAAVRLGGLRRFAIAISVLNLLGHTVLGFEQSWAQPLAALATAYSLELLLELVDARANRRRPQFAGGGVIGFVNFLLSAHITGLAVSMLLYANERLMPIVLGTAVALASKAVLRAPAGGGTRHFFNPSNFGITVVLLLFPWVGIAPPYMFTENTSGAVDWILPGLIVVSGTFVNWRFTGKLPLIAGWLGGFALQAVVRHLWCGTPLAAAWLPMTGLAFVLYTFYMVTDPATTPSGARGQILFGAGVAATYSVLMLAHVVFGLFFALTIVCLIRGAGLHAVAWVAQARRAIGEPQRGPGLGSPAREASNSIAEPQRGPGLGSPAREASNSTEPVQAPAMAGPPRN